MKKLSLLLAALVLCLNPGYGQQQSKNESNSISENGKYFGYIKSISRSDVDSTVAEKNYTKRDIYEFRYYDVATQEPILKYQFHSAYIPSIKISPDGKTIAIDGSSTYMINAMTKSIISDKKKYYGNITFPYFDNCFLSSYKKSRTIDCYDTFNGKRLKSYKKSTTAAGYGNLWFTNDDKYIIQQKSSTKLNIWKVGNENKIKTISANTFRIDYSSGTITFVRGLKTTTYLLDKMKLIHQSDLKYFIRDYTRQKKINDRTNKVKFGGSIISSSGNFMILPFTENKVSSLMLCSTQRDENKEIPIDGLNKIINIEWLSDSVLILNHENNTTTLLNLYDYQNTSNIDFGLTTKKYIRDKELNISPDYNFYVTSKKNLFVTNFTLNNIKNNTQKTMPSAEFITYSPTGNYFVVKNIKTDKYGVIKSDDDNYTFLPFHDSIPPIYEPENLEDDEEIPADYNPYKITAYKHISELRDTSALVNLLLKNIEYTDSTISINAHLIDDNGVYYYGASSEDWKHIWCNLLLKSGNNPLKQITDFEIIEHRDNIFLPFGTAIVMDHSGSMGQNRAMKLQKAVEEYIRMKVKDDAFALIKFDQSVGIESYPTKNKLRLIMNFQKEGLKGYGGATSMLDAANAGISILKNYDDYLKNTLVILTDGMENSSYINKVDLIQRAIKNNINVYIIGYGKYVDEDYLKSITNNTNGSYYKIYRTKDFEWIFKDIHAKVRNYYEIKFKSDFQGEQKSILKVCITNNQSDTLGINFSTIPFPKEATNAENKAGEYKLIDSQEEINKLSNVDNIKNFDNVKSQLYEPKIDTTDELNNLIEEEFDKIELTDIKFEFSTIEIIKSTLKGLDELYEFLSKNIQVKIEISGHTDSDGDANSNMELSEKRAKKIKSILIDKGISENRIQTKSYGDLFPMVPNTTEENKQKNRRVEFSIINQISFKGD